jgi:hypothetical protein
MNIHDLVGLADKADRTQEHVKPPNRLERALLMAAGKFLFGCYCLLIVVAMLLSGCSSSTRTGTLPELHARAQSQCTYSRYLQCMAEMRAEDEACGPFCDVLHYGVPDERACREAVRKVCQSQK